MPGWRDKNGQNLAGHNDAAAVHMLIFREPAVINAAQIVGNLLAAGCGLMAALGGFPTIVTGQIGPVLSVGVGSVLLFGGLLGAVTVAIGMWWLERVALLIVGLGWFLLLPATLSFAMAGRSTGGIWLVAALLVAALCDVFKRYRRIDWAYLDPTRN
jgi:hypothetical protein